MLLVAAQGLRVPQPPSINHVEMLSDTDGYLVTPDRLLWTSTGGIGWQDRTPPVHGGFRIAASCHFGSSHIWLLIQILKPPDTGEVSISVASTSDSGKSWSVSAVPIQDRNLLSGGAGYISFGGTQHGWFELRYPDNTQWSRGGLFTTSNGGKTWARLPNPPILDEMKFTSAQNGWLAGGAGPHPGLFLTLDGGFNWTERKVPYPGPEDNYQRSIGVPQFADGVDFVIAGDDNLNDEWSRFVDGKWVVHSGFVWDIYRSTDGGVTWSALAPDSKMINDQHAFTFFAGSELMQILPSDESITTRSGSSLKHAVSPAPLHAPLTSAVDASFVDPMRGWVVLFGSDCSNRARCEPGTIVLATKNGGATYTDITPGH